MTIAEIRARRAAITPGEWYRYMRGVMVKDYSTDTGVAHVAVANQIGTDNIMDAPQGTSNATFIAAAPADIDYLLATIDKLAAAQKHLIDELRELQESMVQDMVEAESIPATALKSVEGWYGAYIGICRTYSEWLGREIKQAVQDAHL